MKINKFGTYYTLDQLEVKLEERVNVKREYMYDILCPLNSAHKGIYSDLKSQPLE